VSSLLLSYDTQRASLQTQEESITFLNEEIKTLQKDHENQRMRKQAQIETLRERIDVLEQELDDLLDGPDTYDIQQQRNSIRQAQLRLARAEDQQDDYQIIAEFDGRVRTVDIVEGEQYELDDRKFIVVENPNLIELELQVSQIDIVKIKEGDPVIITFDAYPNNPIKANITSRNVNPKANGR
jgi:HlyD family secretion protein